MPGHRIFIILENPKERMKYVRFFEDLGFLVDTTPDGADAIAHLIEKYYRGDLEEADQRRGLLKWGPEPCLPGGRVRVP